MHTATLSWILINLRCPHRGLHPSVSLSRYNTLCCGAFPRPKGRKTKSHSRGLPYSKGEHLYIPSRTPSWCLGPPSFSMADEDSSLLLELPAELRIRIYAYAVSLPRNPSGRYVMTNASSNSDNASSTSTDYGSPLDSSKLAIPSLAQVNRQIRSELIPILYGTTTIALDYAAPPKRSMPFRSGGLMSLLNRVRLTSEYSAVWFLSLQSRCQMSAIGIQEEKFEDALGEFTRSAVV